MERSISIWNIERHSKAVSRRLATALQDASDQPHQSTLSRPFIQQSNNPTIQDQAWICPQHSRLMGGQFPLKNAAGPFKNPNVLHVFRGGNRRKIELSFFASKKSRKITKNHEKITKYEVSAMSEHDRRECHECHARCAAARGADGAARRPYHASTLQPFNASTRTTTTRI